MHVCQACFSAFFAMPSQYSSAQNTEKRQLCPFQAGEAFVKRRKEKSPIFFCISGGKSAKQISPRDAKNSSETNFPSPSPSKIKGPGKVSRNVGGPFPPPPELYEVCMYRKGKRSPAPQRWKLQSFKLFCGRRRRRGENFLPSS